MNIIPRRLARQDLDLADVFLEDTENEYIVVKEIPEVFSQGRNTFKIFGSEFLKPGIQLKIEILDRLGNTVFVQPIRYRLNQYGLPTLPYIYGSVEVYRPPINVGGAGLFSNFGSGAASAASATTSIGGGLASSSALLNAPVLPGGIFAPIGIG